MFLTLSLVAALTGCSGKISAVKNAPSLEPNFTIEQALADKNCQTSNWTTLRDANGRELVEYSCSFRLDQSSIDRIKRKETGRLEMIEAQPITDYQNARQKLEQILGDDLQVSELRLADESKEIKVIESRIAKIQAGSSEISEQYLNYSESSLKALLAEKKTLIAALQSKINETRAKYEPILSQVIGFESKLSTTVKSMAAQDHKLLEGISAENHKLEHKIHFVVNETSVARVAHGLFVDGEQIELDPYSRQLIARAIESPNDRSALTNWWVAQWPLLNFSLLKFPYYCDYENGYVEVKR